MNGFALPASSGMFSSWGMGGNAMPGMETLTQVAPPNMSPLTAMAPLAQMPSGQGQQQNGIAGALGNIGAAASAQGLGFNLPTANLALSGLQTLGNLWAAYEQNKMAKEQFKYTRDITDTNLANQIRSYNTSLTDRITARAFTQGMSDADRDRYIQENSARRGA